MGKFRRNGAPLPQSGLVSVHGNDSSTSLEQVVVAAVDESYSAIYKNLTYMAVVCSVPEGISREELPRPEAALKAPSDFGLVIACLALPPWGNGYARADLWAQGVWQGLRYANAELQRQGQQPVAIAFIDGDEPGNFKRVGSPISQLEVRFASKHGTRHYDVDVGNLAAGLLRLADGVVGLVRAETDETHKRGDLERMMIQLNNQREPLLACAPAQLTYNGIGGNGHVTT